MHKSMICPLFGVLVFFLSNGASHGSERIPVKVGDKIVEITINQNGFGPTFVSLHENEQTAIKAAWGIPGKIIRLRHGGGRYVSFSIGKIKCVFDPNRIFSSRGLDNISKKCGEKASIEVERLARAILRHINTGNKIIALHNNQDGGYGINSYSSGGSEEKNARYVQIVNDDNDAFFLTTSSKVVDLVRLRHNVILQSDRPFDDGSLSVYASKEALAYTNIETSFGSEGLQQKMIRLIASRRRMHN